MDKRSWPWKKKSSDKHVVEKGATEGSFVSFGSPAEKEGKRPKYVQISMESYAYLNGLEDQVKSYEEQVQSMEDEISELNEKLSEANAEITNKEDLVKQHSKVAEEAVSGWEKAEAEATALKTHLESVTLLKLTAEDRASHLDSALKECMKQIRSLKEENEQKLQNMAVSKAKVFEKMKMELEGKIFDLDQELLRAAAEIGALSRTLQDRSNMLIKLSDEKSQAEVQIELLKSNIESCEKDVNSLKYELHIAKKEVEIRNEERNMSVRSADVANKQHLDGLKKIAKLEAECQRLRGLVRKKLPGPAALAQMKLEVENLGRDNGESRFRRSPGKAPSSYSSQALEFSLKENEFTEHLVAMEEETKMLKEVLAQRNTELQASRSLYAQTASKLQSLETEVRANGQQLSLLKSSQINSEGVFSKAPNNISSLPSRSEEVLDDNGSSAGSWSTGLQKNVEISPRNPESITNLDLMHDFLEIEKLAYSTNESNGTVSNADFSGNRSGVEAQLVKTKSSPSVEQSDLKPQESPVEKGTETQADSHIFAELKSLVSMVLKSMTNENDQGKIIENVKHLIEDMNDCLLLRATKLASDVNDSSYDSELNVAAAKICEFIMILGREAKLFPDVTPDGASLNTKIEVVSGKYTSTMDNGINLIDFVVDISHVFSEASKLHFNFLGVKGSDSETGSSDCIDKIALAESKADPIGCGHFSDVSSDPDVPNIGNLVPTSESSATPLKCSSEEFEQLKLDKDNLVVDLARSMENFENTKSQLQETEHLLAEIKSQLSLAQKSNSLADIQLKCMAESYKSLETRGEELLVEVNRLQGKIESLENELQEERKCHQEALNRFKDLQDKLERIDVSGAVGVDDKACQEKELAAAAEKLAECQETIFLLGKQLKSFRPQPETISSVVYGRPSNVEMDAEGPTVSGTNMQDPDSSEIDAAALQKTGLESPLSEVFGATFIPDSESNNLLTSPSSSKPAKHRASLSGSSAASSTPSRGFSRFFSSTKGKSSNQ